MTSEEDAREARRHPGEVTFWLDGLSVRPYCLECGAQKNYRLWQIVAYSVRAFWYCRIWFPVTRVARRIYG